MSVTERTKNAAENRLKDEGSSIPVIELRSVAVAFDSEVILQNVALRLSPGEIFCLIGPSGHGKSVLLKVLAGLIDPSSGEVLIHGKPRSKLSREERDHFSARTSMLFQKNALFDSLTCLENVDFPQIERLGMPAEKAHLRSLSLLESVGIAHARDLFPDEISGGMQKRLGIARALATEPQLILYDDPTAGLDPITSRKIIRLIKDLQQSTGASVVFVTNEMPRAYQIADRIGMVVDREFMIMGTPEETRSFDDARVQQFIRGDAVGPLTRSSGETIAHAEDLA